MTCNYDGENKHQTVIGDGASSAPTRILVAPITIGDGAYVAAGSTLTEDVPAGALALGRARQTTKEGWAEGRRQAKQAGRPGLRRAGRRSSLGHSPRRRARGVGARHVRNRRLRGNEAVRPASW